MSMTCPACGLADLEVFFEMPQVPVYCNVFPDSVEDAFSAPRGDIRLGYCAECSMIRNVAFDPSLLVYTADYENSLHFSVAFQSFAEATSARLSETFDLGTKDIVEIGCGKGDFLALLGAGGANRCTGFDVSYNDNQVDRSGVNLKIHKAFYSAESYRDVQADLLVCRHVLEHVDSPDEFLKGLLPIIREEGGAYFEVPDAMFTLRDLGIWDLIYEHCSYFAAPALERLFRRSGYAPTDVYSTFGGQFLSLEARRDRGATNNGRMLTPVTSSEVATHVQAFAAEFDAKVGKWNRVLAQRLGDGLRIAVWGAGSKGVTFLNTVDRGAEVHTVVDINERKQGRYVAGTGQRIESPSDLVDRGIDCVLVMNSNYRDEILSQCDELGLTPEFLAV